jgi:hypothetical protein
MGLSYWLCSSQFNFNAHEACKFSPFDVIFIKTDAKPFHFRDQCSKKRAASR